MYDRCSETELVAAVAVYLFEMFLLQSSISTAITFVTLLYLQTVHVQYFSYFWY